MILRERSKSRGATAAVEFAVCLPLLLMILSGTWEVGRIVEIQAVVCNGAREAARDASFAVDNLATVTSNSIIYLQSAEPQAFGSGDSTSTAAATGLSASQAGYTVTDTTRGKTLFTLIYSDITQPSLSPMDPTQAAKLDVYTITIQVPYSSVTISPLQQITGASTLTTTLTWLCMRDTPFSVNAVLPAQ